MSCRFEVLSTTCFRPPQHLGIQRVRPNTKITNKKIPAIVIPTILLVVKNFLDFPDFASFCEDGPSACLPEVGSVDGASGGVGLVCDVDGEAGEGNGATFEFNGFPSFLHIQKSKKKKKKRTISNIKVFT